jgi:uncharacterized protein (DUF2235 family)
MNKRIITCSDGTWNSPNKLENGQPVKTNVQKIFDYIEKRDATSGVIQIKYYDEGIGAQGNLLTRWVNGATGNGIDENIMDAYKFICWNYEPGDEIYLFGFSRGAYTARSLAGLIRKCGIISINDLDLIEDAYKLYRDKDYGPNSGKANSFRKKYSFEVNAIRFIGVWDTVGALGIPLNIFQWYNKRKYAFYDCALSSIVENAYHALAVDEKRSTFEPAWWTKSENTLPDGFVQTLEQRWFSGVHSNVGGGYADSGLSDIALAWLFKKAWEKGLSLDKKFLNDFNADYSAKIYPSAGGFYSLLPKKERKIIADGIESFVDDSVYERMKRMGNRYQPANVPTKSK